MASVIITPTKNKIFNQLLNLGTLPVECVLLADTYTPSTSHEFLSDVTAHELSGGSYVRQTLANKVIQTVGDEIYWNFDDPTFPSVTLTGANGVKHAAFAVNNGGAETSDQLICVNEFASKLEPSAQDLTLLVPTNGLLKI